MAVGGMSLQDNLDVQDVFTESQRDRTDYCR